MFLNTKGGPIQQENLGNKIWTPALTKAGVEHRRMYETRHTFASWAIGSGESPEWVARTLGHVDTTMVYRTYARYIPNLTRHDGSAFEMQYAAAAEKQKEAVQIGTMKGTMDCPEELSSKDLEEKTGRDDWI